MDGGCQSNFILESLAKDLNLKIIKSNVSVSIININFLRVHNTKKIMECKLKIDITENVVGEIFFTITYLLNC